MRVISCSVFAYNFSAVLVHVTVCLRNAVFVNVSAVLFSASVAVNN